MVEIIVRKRTFSTFNVSFSLIFFRRAVVYGTQKKRGAISMGGVGKGEGTVYPLYSGIFVLLNKIVLKCIFQSLDSGCKLLQSSSNKRYYLHVHEPKCLPSF